MNHFYRDNIFRRLGSRKSMIEYLENHFRYFTMNSWNRSTSYANNVKIYNLPVDSNVAYDIISDDSFYREINHIIDIFDSSYNYEFQAKFNGRSGGYIVLTAGGRKESGYKSRCINCGQLNYKTVEETQSSKCGRCGDEEGRLNLSHPVYSIYTSPGVSIDDDEYFDEWDTDELKDRVELVSEFDKLCDNILDYLARCCKKGAVLYL